MNTNIYGFKVNTIITILLLLVCYGRSHSQVPTIAWVKQLGGADGTHPYSPPESGSAISVGMAGSIYTAGHFSGTTDFDPGADTFALTSRGDLDIYVSKLDAAGNLVWVRQIGGTAEDEAMAITTDAAGNVYVTGYFNELADFDPGSDTFNLTGNYYDIFILKLNSNGDFVWAKKIGGEGFDIANGIALDPIGNIYITGGFGDTVDFDPGPGEVNLVCTGGIWDADIFIAKLDNTGNLLWAKAAGAAEGYDMGRALVTDTSGNVYTTGNFTGTTDFDPGPATANLTTVLWDDIFVLKLDASGNYVWAKQFGGDGTQESGNAIVLDGFGNIYTTGRFSSTVDFDPGSGVFNLSVPNNNGSHIFVSKLSNTGDFVWARQFGTNDASNMGMNEGFAIKVDGLSNVYTAGNFGGIVDFNPGSGAADTFNLYSPIDYDAFIAKLDASGNFAWALQFGLNDFTAEVIKSLDMDAAGNIYTTGYFYGMSDFDPGTGTSYLSSFGYADAFVHKLATCNSFDTITTTACNNFTLNESTYNQSGTYWQHYIGANGCDSTLVLQLTINTQAPDATVSQNGATLTANASGITYQWLRCDNGYQVIPGADAQSFTAVTDGSYAVVVTSHTCSDTSDCITVTSLGIKEQPNIRSLSVYPNPVHDFINLKADHLFHKASILLTDIMGRTLVVHDSISGTGFRFSMASYPSGVYILSVKEGKKMMYIKVIKD